MDLKLFGKKIELSLVISVVTLMIVLFTTYSCCHTQNVIESMTNNKKSKKKSKKGGLKEGHETIYNSQAKMPGTVVNVATPTPVVNPHVVPQHTHAPVQQPTQPLSLNINLNKKKNEKGSTTTAQASETDASTTGDQTTVTTEGFSNLDDNTGSEWMTGALDYAVNMKNEDHTKSGINANYSAENWTPDHTLAFFSNNVKKESCCTTSNYSVNSACPCITSDQFSYLSSRGGNHTNGTI